MDSTKNYPLEQCNTCLHRHVCKWTSMIDGLTASVKDSPLSIDIKSCVEYTPQSRKTPLLPIRLHMELKRFNGDDLKYIEEKGFRSWLEEMSIHIYSQHMKRVCTIALNYYWYHKLNEELRENVYLVGGTGPSQYTVPDIVAINTSTGEIRIACIQEHSAVMNNYIVVTEEIHYV